MSTNLRERLRAALRDALKQRDAVLVTALRTALAALDNAEAVPIPEQDHRGRALEATPVGVGAREMPRRDLPDEDVERLVRAEISERQNAARIYEEAGMQELAGRLRREADALAMVAGLPGAPEPD